MTGSFDKFTTPAHQGPKDFKELGLEHELPQFLNDWSNNVAGWTEASIIGNPWSNVNDAPRGGYYNPLVSGFGPIDAVISWTPFPNRLLTFFTDAGAENNPQTHKQLSQTEVFAMADSGTLTINGTTYLLYGPDQKAKDVLVTPAKKCPEIDWTGKWDSFSPWGPRGWLDEYCEWSIAYNSDGKMTSVMFTCENPAYYLTMWRIDPEAVLGIYRKYIDQSVQAEDLYLRYPYDGPTGKKGEVVVDPTTGNPAYDPVNKWNNGTKRVPGQQGGAMHLTSPPNTLSAEIYLAAASTIQRPSVVSQNPQSLICCAKYGQNFRNSDPHIGFVGNTTARQAEISLTDPVGLYIQQPANFYDWKGPKGQDVSKYWKITRGTAGTGPNGSDQILHAVFEIPEIAGFTINDVKIQGQKIDHIGVIADQMKIALSVKAKPPASTQGALDCVAARTEGLQPWPAQLVPETLFYGMSPTDLPALFEPGTENSFVLIVSGASKGTTAEAARIQFNVDGISAKVTKFLPNASAVPGQTDGGGTQGYIMQVSVAAHVRPGPVQVRALNPDEAPDPSPEEHPWEVGLAVVPDMTS